tara:strand:- start:8 stop:187 length:180 start_codon:yes stop_codon:yes gene_type:complete
MRTPREKRFGFLQEVNFTADRFFFVFLTDDDSRSFLISRERETLVEENVLYKPYGMAPR